MSQEVLKWHTPSFLHFADDAVTRFDFVSTRINDKRNAVVRRLFLLDVEATRISDQKSRCSKCKELKDLAAKLVQKPVQKIWLRG